MVDISILIPVYKRWEYTKMCLEHHIQLIRFESFRIQIVIVDDGNPPEYAEACIKPFVNPQPDIVQWVKLGKHRGLRVALVEGLKRCKGKYIQKLDNDCLLPPGWFSSAVEALKKVDAVSPNVSESNAKKFLRIRNQAYVRSTHLGGLWFVEAKKIENATSLSGGRPGLRGGDILRHCPKIKTVAWSTQFTAQDMGFKTGTHPLHINSKEHRQYSKEVGRVITW